MIIAESHFVRPRSDFWQRRSRFRTCDHSEDRSLASTVDAQKPKTLSFGNPDRNPLHSPDTASQETLRIGLSQLRQQDLVPLSFSSAYREKHSCLQPSAQRAAEIQGEVVTWVSLCRENFQQLLANAIVMSEQLFQNWKRGIQGSISLVIFDILLMHSSYLTVNLVLRCHQVLMIRHQCGILEGKRCEGAGKAKKASPSWIRYRSFATSTSSTSSSLSSELAWLRLNKVTQLPSLAPR